MLFSLLFLALGITILVFAGDFLVNGAVALAQKFGISPLIIGLTVVAFGTSAPELFVSLQAALSGAPGIAIGNVVGSNIANVLLVVGLPSLFGTLDNSQPGLKRNMSVMLVATIIFMVMLGTGTLGRIDGIVLFGFLVAFIFWQLRTARCDRNMALELEKSTAENVDDECELSNLKIFVFLMLGIFGLPLGAHLTVYGASTIASHFGISDEIIGLTIVAIGTSLPELATTLSAVKNKSSAVALGNIVGSNLFNILCIMGITSLVVPLQVSEHIIHLDMWVMFGTSALLAAMAYAGIRAGKTIALAMIGAYVAYIVSVF